MHLRSAVRSYGTIRDLGYDEPRGTPYQLIQGLSFEANKLWN